MFHIMSDTQQHGGEMRHFRFVMILNILLTGAVTVSGQVTSSMTVHLGEQRRRMVNSGEQDFIPLLVGAITGMPASWKMHGTFYFNVVGAHVRMLPTENIRVIRENGAQGIVIAIDRVLSSPGDTIALIPFVFLLGRDTCAWIGASGYFGTEGPVLVNIDKANCTICASICREGGARIVEFNGTARLAQNHPNPFNGGTSFQFHLIEAGRTRIRVYAPSGRCIATIVDAWMPPGDHTATFDASALPSGVYQCVMETPSLYLRRSLHVVK